MPIKQKGSVLTLEGVIGVEDAENLYGMLRELELPKVNLGRCYHVHAAVLQLLLGFNVKITKYPKNKQFEGWLKNSLQTTDE